MVGNPTFCGVDFEMTIDLQYNLFTDWVAKNILRATNSFPGIRFGVSCKK